MTASRTCWPACCARTSAGRCAGFPGILRLPILQQLFADNDTNIRQTDIVMLLTPRIVRSHQLTANDLSPIYIGTQGNMAVGGPPPVFGGGAAPAAAPAARTAAAAGARPGPPGAPVPPAAPTAPTGAARQLADSRHDHGTLRRAAAAPPPAGAGQRRSRRSRRRRAGAGRRAAPATPPAPAAPGHAAAPPHRPGARRARDRHRCCSARPAPSSASAAARISVPVSISGASRLSTVSLSVNFNPAVLRVRSVQEGNLLRQGGVQATFTQKIDAAAGRVDIAVVRPGDVLGRVGHRRASPRCCSTPSAPGTSTLTVNGVGTLAGGGAAPLQFQPVTITVK